MLPFDSLSADRENDTCDEFDTAGGVRNSSVAGDVVSTNNDNANGVVSSLPATSMAATVTA
jgi:hypothetical protein